VSTEEMVRELWDRQQITDVMLRFGRGLDLHDWDMYAATLTDPFEVDFFDLTGRPTAVTTPKVWARFAEGWKISRLKHTFQWCDGNPTLIDASDPAWQEAAAAVFGAD
jgi:hypothetical protein